MEDEVTATVHRAYRAGMPLADQLQALLGALARQVKAVEATIEVAVMLPPQIHLLPPRLRAGVTVRHAFALTYAGGVLGELRLGWARPGPEVEILRFCTLFARRCALLVKRHELQAWAASRLSRPLLLVGVCAPRNRLDAFVEKAARSRLPVVLNGEFGTDTAELAAAIHAAGPCCDAPFVEIQCADPTGAPAEWFEQAQDGSLFLNGIDALPLALQVQLPHRIHCLQGQRLQGPAGTRCRVIVSCSSDLSQRVREGRFSQTLLAELDFLATDVPPLRERLGELDGLVGMLLARHGFDPSALVTDELLAALRGHTWPENLFELERVVVRLAAMGEGEPLRGDDLLAHVPRLRELPGALPEQTLVPRAAPGFVTPRTAQHPPRPVAHWACIALQADAAALEPVHDAVRRAVLFLGEHHADALSLGLLAREVHVSPSHLGYLLRTELGTSFKPLLQCLRIEQAKRLLCEQPRLRITEIAQRVGFGDLSHFERSFRRQVGACPRAYRRGGQA
ncbi:helix-turn-helix domain-containing protein [Stenotrophomonas sp. GZD-301]|uniref:helix-turn-helix domain-containing protein n=1 Tax=Stenotrophomonas sp. GZD-301 TaxID=3404814 RepID=UPI003BB77466